MEPPDVSHFFVGHGLEKKPGETRCEFSKRIYIATRNTTKWHPSYLPTIDYYFKIRDHFRRSVEHYHFFGYDQRLRFLPQHLPENFDLDQYLFIFENECKKTTYLLAAFNDQSFFFSTSEGHYVSMLDQFTHSRVRGGVETMIGFMGSKLRNISKP